VHLRLWVIAIPAALALPALAQTTQDLTPPTTTWYISGRVMMEDGTEPTERVMIENVCNGMTYPVAIADSRGQFSFRIGASGARLVLETSAGRAEAAIGMAAPLMGSGGAGGSYSGAQDSTQQSSTPEPRQAGGGPDVARGTTEHSVETCELGARLGGYRAEPVSLRNRRPLDSSPVGTIVLHRIGKVEGRTVSVTTLAAPKGARVAYEKGMKALERKKVDEARRQLEKAVRLYSQFAPAWSQLGQIQLAQSHPEDAARSFGNAIRADPSYVQSYLGLAIVQVSQRQWDKLSSTTDLAVKLDPVDYPQAYYLNALGNFNSRKLEAAEKSAREAQRLDKLHRWPQAWHLLGLILASYRDFAAAAAQFRDYLRFAPQAADADEVQKLLAWAEELGGAAQE
jgi:Flp pilus assembly protein TadD